MSEDKAIQTASPPYIAFASLKTFVAGLKEHGIPSRIDRSIMTNFSGAVAGQVLTSLRFLNLVNGDNQPGPILRDLVTTYGGPAWKDVVAVMVTQAYRPMFDIDLTTATPSLFNEQFKKSYGGADAVMRKCMTFFLNAVREAEMQVSPRLLSGTKPRSGPTKKRTPKTTVKATKADGPRPTWFASGQPVGGSPIMPKKKPSEVLFEEFDPSTMPPDIQESVWALIKYFKSNDK